MIKRTLAVVLALILACLAGQGSAAAAGGERIDSYAITIRAEQSGRLDVTEVITYRFDQARHGIFRVLQDRRRYDAHHDQLYRISHVSAQRAGKPEPASVSEQNDATVIKIGRSSGTVDGVQTYTIRYDIAGALPRRNGRPEVYFNAIGTGWDVPISNVSVSIKDGSKPLCFAGDLGSSTRCASARSAGGGVAFHQGSLAPHQGLTVVAQLPAAQQVNGPILTERNDFGYRMARDSWVWIAAAAVIALLLLGVGLLVWRNGRDRRYAGQVPGLQPASGQDSGEEFRPVLSHPDGPVEFVPPKGMRPGLAGVLMRQTSDMRDATATIVDLAVRGYLRIEEGDSKHWTLVRQEQPGGTLEPYEQQLLAKFFRGDREELQLPDMRRSFSSGVSKLQDHLMQEGVRRQWYDRRPDEVRQLWRRLGVGTLIGGVVLAFILAGALNVGLIGVAVALSGLALIVAARWMPARTAAGSAAYAQALGFRRYLRVAEAEQIRAEEREGVFSRYLPYAIAFDEADRWVRTFAAAGVVTAATTGAWYVGIGVFDPGGFATSMGSFNSSLAASGASGSYSGSGGMSGFSGGAVGGGAGGGGGGSW